MTTRRSAGRDKPARARAAPGRTRRDRDAEVLRAAARIFSERGYSQSTMQDIADALGMFKGSLYYYIDTKEGLLFSLLDQVHDEVDLLLAEWVGRTELTSLGRLRGYIRSLVLYNTANLPKMAVYYHDIDRLNEEHREVIQRRRRPHQEFMEHGLRDAQASGHADPSLDPVLMADFAFGTLIWIYRWYGPRLRVRREAIADSCSEFIMRGIVGS